MAAAKKPKAVKAPPKSSFDITQPGAPSLGASPTSKAIIIKHAPVQDPMVTEDKPPASSQSPTTAPTLSPPHAKKITIQPLHAAAAEPAAQPDVVLSVAPPPKPKPISDMVSTPTSMPSVQLAPARLESTSDEPISGVPADGTEPETDDRLAKERALKIKAWASGGDYFLPIETTEQRRSRQVAIAGAVLIVVLALAWYNVALDAHLLPNTYHLPHSMFFKAK